MSKSRPEVDAESSDDEVPVSRKDIEQFKNDVTVTQLEDWGNAGEEGLITEAQEWYDRIVSTFGKSVFTKQERSRLKAAFTENTILALRNKAVKDRKALEEELAESAKGRKALEEKLAESAKELAHAKEFANKEKISVLISQPCIERTIRNVSYSNTSRVPHVRSVSRKEIDGDFLIPINVKEWVTFAVDAKLTLLPLGDDILVGPDSWPTKTEFDCGMNESTSQADMSGSMLQPIEKYHELDPRSPNIMKFQEEGHWLGGRVDISWTRKIRDSDTSKLLMLSSFHEMNVAAENIVFLVHEHKAPKAFPFVPEPGAEFTVDRKTGKKIPAKYGHRHRSRSQRTSQGSVSSSQSSLSLPEMMEEDNRLKQEVDLVAIWDRFEKCKRSDYFFKFVAPICQLFTYMVSTGLKFGILSTFDKTWFCRRDKEGGMKISQAFDACVGRGIHATRRAYLGIITLALKDVEATGYGLVKGKRTLYEAMKNHTNDTFKKFADTLADGKKDLDSDISRTFADKFAYFCKEKFNGGLQNSTRQNAIDAVREVLPLSDKDFYLPLDGETLHRNSRTIVHRCSLSGAPMIVKRWAYSLLPRRPDDNDAAKLGLQNERWAYEVKLASLQGIAIPFLIYAGRYATMPFVLAVSDEGESLERLLMAAADDEERATLLETYFDEAHEALAAIHSCGVLHNDIAARNIVIHPERGVKIIDFESASEYCEDLLAQEEMREFFAIFNRTVTGTPRKTGKKIWRRQSLARLNYPRNLRESKPPMDGTQDNDGKKRRILSFLPGGLSPSRASDSSSPSSE